jgi:putative ABC transport system permease protein
MLSNYCKIALRNLRRHSFYTIVNVFGLSLGIACSIILFGFVSYHLQFDAYHEKKEQIYRVVTDLHLDDGTIQYDRGAPLALAAAIEAEIPQVAEQAFLFRNYRDRAYTVAVARRDGTGKQLFAEHGSIGFADRHWFNIFDYQWEAGNPYTALEEPNTAVLTRSQAQKYFGTENPIGKMIRLDDKLDVKVTGLLKDYASETDTKVDVFISLSSMKSFYPGMYHEIATDWGWINSSNSLFVLLSEGVSPEVVDRAIAAVKGRHMGTMAKYYDFQLQPMSAVHFDARYGGVIPKSLLTTLSIVGLVILIIACVNFINLATAQNSGRSKEISTRKVMGSSMAGIFWQFMTETAMITFSAALVSLVWVALVLPVLNPWLKTNIELRLFHDWTLIAALLLLTLVITFAAGVYPALVLSRLKPVALFKTRYATAKHPWLRKGLMVLQNLIAQSLIIGSLIIMLQLRYLKTADLGFNKEGVVMVPVPRPDKQAAAYMRNELLGMPGVKDASFCYRPPASEMFKAGSVKFDNRPWEDYTALCTLGDAHYLNTFGLQLIAGRNITESDTVREFLVSEGLVRKLGFTSPADVLGHQLVAGAVHDHPGTIVGVVKDFHLHSLHRQVEPVIMATSSVDYVYVGIRLEGANPAENIRRIREIWQTAYPNDIFEYHFLDDQIAAFYEKEDLLSKLIGGATVLAIAISCVGLLGLVSLLTVQRTKEIGIRKVVGASVSNIVLLLSADFVKLVLLALFLASIAGWLIMNNWLRAFAYRIDMPWWVFMAAGVGNLLLALCTICYHALKAALLNPVKSLKAE